MVFEMTEPLIMRAPEAAFVPRPRFSAVDTALNVNIPEALKLGALPLQPGVPARINLGSLCALKSDGMLQSPSGATSETRSPRSSQASDVQEMPERWGIFDEEFSAPKSGLTAREVRRFMGQLQGDAPRNFPKDLVRSPACAAPAGVWTPQSGQHRVAYAPDAMEPPLPIQMNTEKSSRDSRGAAGNGVLCAQGAQRGRVRNREVAPVEHGPTLCAVFRELRAKDPQCVLKLRKLHHLGAGSVNTLQRHFERLGCVDEVFVVYSQVKAPSRGGVVRCKPSGLGFVAMTSPDDVEAVLRLGEEQTIGSTKVIVERFRLLDGSSD